MPAVSSFPSPQKQSSSLSSLSCHSSSNISCKRLSSTQQFNFNPLYHSNLILLYRSSIYNMSSFSSDNWRARSSTPPSPTSLQSNDWRPSARSSSPTKSSNNWRALTPPPSPVSSSSRRSSVEINSPSKSGATTRDDFTTKIRPGSILYLPRIDRAINAYMGKTPLKEGVYGHPVLVTKINTNSVEVLQCTSFNGRGTKAVEIDYSEVIGIDEGKFGELQNTNNLKNLHCRTHVIKSVMIKPTFAYKHVYEFRFNAFNFTNFGGRADCEISQIPDVIFHQVYRQVYEQEAPAASSDFTIDASDFNKLKRKSSGTALAMPSFSPFGSPISSKRLSVQSMKLQAVNACC